MRILERRIHLRSNEVWPNERHAPEGAVQSTDDAGTKFFKVPYWWSVDFCDRKSGLKQALHQPIDG